MPRMNWTIDEHRRASRVLKEIQGRLREFARPPLNQMPCRISKYVERIELAIMQMRSDLEDEMFRSLRDHPEVSTHVYYPRDEEGQE
jgi:hypothetical protein